MAVPDPVLELELDPESVPMFGQFLLSGFWVVEPVAGAVVDGAVVVGAVVVGVVVLLV